jgi:hypothetical protein
VEEFSQATTINTNEKTLIDPSKDVDPEVKVDKTKCMLLSPQ